MLLSKHPPAFPIVDTRLPLHPSWASEQGIGPIYGHPVSYIVAHTLARMGSGPPGTCAAVLHTTSAPAPPAWGKASLHISARVGGGSGSEGCAPSDSSQTSLPPAGWRARMSDRRV